MQRNLQLSFLVAFLLFTVYLLTSRGGYDGYELENFLTAENIFFHQKFSLAKGYDSLPGVPNTTGPLPIYARHGLGSALLDLPFYAVGFFTSQFVHLPTPKIPTSSSKIAVLNPIRLVSVSLNLILLTILTTLLLYWLTVRLFNDQRLALTTALIYGLGTIAWPYAAIGLETLLTFSAFGVFAFLWLYRLEGKAVFLILSGICIFFLVNSKNYALFLALPLLFYAFWIFCKNIQAGKPFNRRSWLVFWLFVFFSFLFFFGFNFWKAGNLLGQAQDQVGAFFSLETFFLSFLTFTISTGKSIFVYSPPLVFIFWGLGYFWQRQKMEILVIGALFLAGVLLFFPLWFTASDEMWGPRYFVYLTPFLLLLTVPVWQKLQSLNSMLVKGFLALLLTVSLFIQLTGVLFWGVTPLKIAQATGAKTMEEINFIPFYSPVFVGTKLLPSTILRIITGRSLNFQTTVLPSFSASGASPLLGPKISLADYDRFIILPFRFLVKFNPEGKPINESKVLAGVLLIVATTVGAFVKLVKDSKL